MSDINSSSYYSDLLPGLVVKWFSVVPKEYELLYPQMFKVESSDRAYEIHATHTGMGLLRAKPQGAVLSLDSSQEAYKPRYEHVTYALGFSITKEAKQDGNAFKDAKKFILMLRKNADKSKEIIAASVLNFAGTSNYTMPGGDNVTLANASHPTASGNQSNILSSGADLSEASLEAIRVNVENALDNRGLKVKLMIKDLIINPAQRALAHRILKSEKQIDTLNNANFLKDSGTVKSIIVNPYLTSTTQWQVTTDIEDGLKFMVRQDVEVDSDNVFMTKSEICSVDMRVSSGWDDFRGLYISL